MESFQGTFNHFNQLKRVTDAGLAKIVMHISFVLIPDNV
jgi:hypothetical protein